jgi:hypothetical protein
MANLTNIRVWHDGLVSGRFPQDTGTLVRDGKYCCLGVACHLAIEAGVEGITEVDDPNDHGFRITDAEVPWFETDTLPHKVIEWLDINTTDPELLTEDDGHVAATTLNDDAGYSFVDIAACIRRTWPDAFGIPLNEGGV